MHPIEIAEHGLVDKGIMWNDDRVVAIDTSFVFDKRLVKRKNIFKYLRKKLRKKIRRQIKKVRRFLNPEVLYPSV